MNNNLQLSAICFSEINKKFNEIDISLNEQHKMLYNINKTLSLLSSEISDLKNYIHNDDFNKISKNQFNIFDNIFDIDDQEFDKAWFLKHYKVDCPEYDQPLSIKELHNLGYDMTPEQYGKYIVSFDDFNNQKVEEL